MKSPKILLMIFLLMVSLQIFAVEPKVVAGFQHVLGLYPDGTVIATGNNNYGECNVNDWNNIIDIACSMYISVGLKSDNTVVAAGRNTQEQCNVESWTDIIQVASGKSMTIGLKSNGTVVATGYSSYYENVETWTDVIQIAVGDFHVVGLKSDGTVITAGSNYWGQGNVESWTEIIQVTAGANHTVGLKSDGTVVAAGTNQAHECEVESWSDIVNLSTAFYNNVGLKIDGTVLYTGPNNYNEANIQASSDFIQVSASYYFVLGLKPNGRIESFGNLTFSNNLSEWKLISNEAPAANAGDNITITSDDSVNTTLFGSVSDPDADDVLTYSWVEGDTILKEWTEVDAYGNCTLSLSQAYLGVGTHTLTLLVSDGELDASDDMILVIDNTAPHAAASGSGVYELNTSIKLGGFVSDYDGDNLAWVWIVDNQDLADYGVIPAVAGGTPVELPEVYLNLSEVGEHTVVLEVSDGINQSVKSVISINIVDTSVPTLAPVINKTILWPPKLQMVEIMINANAHDNSGLPVELSASIVCDEEIVEGDSAWTEPVINNEDGTISFQLKADRDGEGDGRVYTVIITATDDSGNESSASLEVIVPHDKSK